MGGKFISLCVASVMTISMLAGCGAREGTIYTAADLLKNAGYEDLADHVKLCDLSTISVDSGTYDAGLTDDTQSYAVMLAADNPQHIATDRTVVQDGDCVSISYSFQLEDSSAAGDTITAYVEIGNLNSSIYPTGFDTELVGHKVGESFALDMTFSEDAADNAGKPVRYQITVNGIYDLYQPQSYDEITDSYVSDVYGYSTVEEYMDYLKEYIGSLNDWRVDTELNLGVLEQIEKK